jgi:hypothetical protein
MAIAPYILEDNIDKTAPDSFMRQVRHGDVLNEYEELYNDTRELYHCLLEGIPQDSKRFQMALEIIREHFHPSLS